MVELVRPVRQPVALGVPAERVRCVTGDVGGVRLRVHDDGEAARPATTVGYGLLGMAERAKLLGGACKAGPDPVGGWTVEANRIAAVEDRLTGLEASAPDDTTRTGTRTLRDAVRASRGRVGELLQSGDPQAISPILIEVAAELEAALGSWDQAE